MAIAIVDYAKGNLMSCCRGMQSVGYDAVITDDPKVIVMADGIILPGVGAFADASATMLATGQKQAIRTRVAADGVPFLGICLGMQLIMERGDEGMPAGQWAEGLGFMRGHCVRMADVRQDGTKVKVPHVGWNSVRFLPGDDNPLFAGVPQDTFFYFTHSYRSVCEDEADVSAVSEHAECFPSVVRKGNIFGTQFHPEKSSTWGLQVLKYFGSLVYGH